MCSIEKTLAEYEKAIFTRLESLGFDPAKVDLDAIWDDWIDTIPSHLAVQRQIRKVFAEYKNGNRPGEENA